MLVNSNFSLFKFFNYEVSLSRSWPPFFFFSRSSRSFSSPFYSFLLRLSGWYSHVIMRRSRPYKSPVSGDLNRFASMFATRYPKKRKYSARKKKKKSYSKRSQLSFF